MSGKTIWYNTCDKARKTSRKAIMSESTISAGGGRAAGTRLGLFLASVGYPDRAAGGVVSFAMRVDGFEVEAEEIDGRIVLSCALTDDDSMLPTLEGYAAGRMLAEDAVLAYGAVGGSRGANGDGAGPGGPSGSRAFLWQDVPAGAGAREMVRLFETFMDSCDWWLERVKALRVGGAEAPETDRTMVIRP